MKVAEHARQGFDDLVHCGQTITIDAYRRFFLAAFPDWRTCTGDEERCPCRFHACKRNQITSERRARTEAWQARQNQLARLRRAMPRCAATGWAAQLAQIIRDLEEPNP